MDITSRFPVSVVIVVIAVAILSGPLVNGVDFTREDEPDQAGPLGTGNVTVENISLPSSGTLRKGSFGSGSYYLEVPDGSLDIANRSGHPIVAYEIELTVGNISYNQESVYFVGPETGDQIRLSFERETFSPTEVSAQQYPGQLTVLTRMGNTSTVLKRKNITVEVKK